MGSFPSENSTGEVMAGNCKTLWQILDLSKLGGRRENLLDCLPESIPSSHTVRFCGCSWVAENEIALPFIIFWEAVGKDAAEFLTVFPVADALEPGCALVFAG